MPGEEHEIMAAARRENQALETDALRALLSAALAFSGVLATDELTGEFASRSAL